MVDDDEWVIITKEDIAPYRYYTSNLFRNFVLRYLMKHLFWKMIWAFIIQRIVPPAILWLL